MACDSDEQNAADLPKSTLTYKILKRWKASELKAFLKDRNMKTSGRKDDLIDRICLVEGLNRSGDGSDRSCAELEDKRLKILPSELQEEYNSLRFDRIQENWTRDLKYIPTDFGMEKMKEYLIYSTDKSYDGDSMRQYKTLRSYRLFHEGYVQNIEANVQTRFLIVRAQVMPSESTDRLYRAYVCLNKTTGDIYGGKCRCVAGLGEACSHMGALLFSLENYIALGMNAMPSTTCTEKLCTWNKPASLKVTPKPISEVQMRKIEYGKTISVMTNKTRENYDCRIPEHREVSRPHLKELYQKMSQCNQSCSWVKFYDEDHIVNENAKKLSQHGQSSVPNDVPDVTVKEKNTTEQIITLMRVNNVESTFGEQPSYSDDTDIESQIFKDTCVTYYSSITPMSEDEVTRIEQKTREQANCAEWMKERKGRITASIVGEICKQRKSTPPDAVIRRIFQYGQNAAMQKPKACQHGQKYESTACEVYTAMMKGKCCDIIVEKRGLVVDKHNPWFGVSIDGIVIDSCDRTVLGIVEIKCPYVNAEKLPDVKSIQVLAEKRPGFFLKFSEGRYTLDKNHNYYYQVQAQMGVLKVKWCDFVVCLIAEIGEGGDVHVERIHFNHKVYDEICTKAKEFYINAVIPERLTERVKRGKPLYPGSTTYVYKKKIPT